MRSFPETDIDPKNTYLSWLPGKELSGQRGEILVVSLRGVRVKL